MKIHLYGYPIATREAINFTPRIRVGNSDLASHCAISRGDSARLVSRTGGAAVRKPSEARKARIVEKPEKLRKNTCISLTIARTKGLLPTRIQRIYAVSRSSSNHERQEFVMATKTTS